MVEVSIQILRSDLLPSKNHVILYDFKTFWSKDIRVIGKAGEKLKPVYLPILPLKDYNACLKKGENISVYIEVSVCHKKDVTKPSKYHTYVGLAVTTLDPQIANPNLNPQCQLIPIRSVHNNAEGKLYIKTSAVLLSPHAHVDGSASHIENLVSSTSPYTPADHTFFGEENFSDSDKNDELWESTSASESDWLFSAVDNSLEDLMARDENHHYMYHRHQKADPGIAHNTCCSPDFPFKIAALQEDELRRGRKRILEDQ